MTVKSMLNVNVIEVEIVFKHDNNWCSIGGTLIQKNKGCFFKAKVHVRVYDKRLAGCSYVH